MVDSYRIVDDYSGLRIDMLIVACGVGTLVWYCAFALLLALTGVSFSG